jgi:hypothetical protein
LEQQQIGDQEILLAIKNLGNVSRYDRAFKKLYVILKERHGEPLRAKIVEVATAILLLSEISVADARNAYSAICLLPGFEHVKFSPLLKNLKKVWNHSTQKYATFWDPQPILKQMQSVTPLDMMSVEALRGRLIILFRLLALHRGVDLARTQRTLSMVDNKVFIFLRRKGWVSPKWEQILKFDEIPSLSPFHVMKAYVEKTAKFAPPGGPLLWSLDGKKPLTSNTVNSLTKHFLKKFGVPVDHWKAHSTRGAGVFMYKSLGFSSEEVCEIGQWKNAHAFQAHYLRLGAVEKTKNVLQKIVHKVSPQDCAEPEWLHTPGKNDQGGSNHEGGAQEGGEPNPTRPKRKFSESPPRARKRAPWKAGARTPRGGGHFKPPAGSTLTPKGEGHFDPPGGGTFTPEGGGPFTPKGRPSTFALGAARKFHFKPVSETSSPTPAPNDAVRGPRARTPKNT